MPRCQTHLALAFAWLCISGGAAAWLLVTWAFAGLVDPSLSDEEQTRKTLRNMFLTEAGVTTWPAAFVCLSAAVLSAMNLWRFATGRDR